MEQVNNVEDIMLETDYTNRCGNCHAYLRPEDKYCRYCGTKRGKGRFKPFENIIECVYGPTVKRKYKCSSCGHIWVVGMMGGDNSRYCPQCGKKTVTVLQDRALRQLWGPVGTEEPYDQDDEPVLFSDEEVRSLLAKRQDRADESTYAPEGAELINILREICKDVPDEATEENYPKREVDGDRMELAYRILSVKGSTPEEPKDDWVRCPHCGSSLIAAMSYRLYNKGGSDSEIHNFAGTGNDLIDGNNGYCNYGNSKLEDNSAFLCLKCGKEFGNLKGNND